MTPEIAEEYRRVHQHYGWIAEREADAMNRLDLARPMLAAMPFAAEIDYAKLPDSLGIERWIDIENQGALGSCFPPGTLIRTWRGEQKPIESLTPLDFVVTAEGECGQVMGVVARKFHGEVCRIVAWGHKHLRCTPDHPIRTQRGYIPVSELTGDDWICFPRTMARANEEIETGEFIERRQLSLKRRQSGSVAGRATTTITVSPVPKTIRLTPEFGRIVGLFLAEGCTCAAKTSWTFCEDEENTLVADLIALLKSELGLEPTMQRRGASHTIKVNVHGVEWAKLFEALFGGVQLNRRMPACLTAGPPEFLREVFRGWMEGDGFKHKAGRTTGTTISRQMAHQMFWLGASLGHKTSITTRECKPTHGVRHRHDRWDISVPATDGENYRCRMDETHMWRKVVRVEREPYSGYVFNLHVAGDESYVANGVGVHNCAAHAMTSCAEVAFYHATGEELQFNRLWQYLRAQALDGIVGDSGSVVSSNCQVAQEIGQPLQGLWEYKAVYPRGGWSRWQAENSALAAKLEADAAARKIRSWKPLKNYAETLAWIAAKVGGVNIGIPWGDAMTPDAKGRVERYYRTLRDGGHSVALLDWNKQIADEKGRPYIQLFNSWGKQWGLRGTCFVRPAIIDEWCQSQTVIGVSDMRDVKPRATYWGDFFA